MNYQPTFIKGKEYGDFQRDCKPRYDTIVQYLDARFERRYSVFDLGANYGYFGIRLSFERDAVSVLVDTKPIADVLQKNAPLPVIWLNTRLGGSELQA